jgi:hypothetical protein
LCTPHGINLYHVCVYRSDVSLYHVRVHDLELDLLQDGSGLLVMKTIISELRIFAQLYDKNSAPTTCMYTPSVMKPYLKAHLT